MAPIKFEEEIKEKLELRRIEPSQESWSKLSAQLDKHQGNKRNKFWWFAIAASVVISIFSTVLLLKSPDQLEPQDAFTIEEVQKQPVNEEEQTQQNELVEPTKSVPQNDIIATVETVPQVTEKPVVETTSVVLTETKVNEPSDKVLIADPMMDQSTTSTVVAELDKALIKEVIQQEKGIKETKLNKETDSLLKAAQKALIMDRSMNDSAQIVSASDLLDEVEKEVEPSLRSKVYEVFKGGFKKVKTAVAQRNN